MINGVFETGDKVITKDGEGKVNKSPVTKEDSIEVKLKTGEVKTYALAEVSDDADAG